MARIGIDYTSAVHQGAGIGRMTRDLIRALAELDTENKYTLLVQGREIAYPPSTPHARNAASGIPNENFREVRTWIDERWWNRIWHRLRLPIAVEWAIGSVDLFHSPDFTLPPVRSGTRTIVTIHDLSFLRLPDCFEPALLNYLTTNVPRAVRRADWILADSESTRRDLIELLDASPDRVAVIYPAVQERFRSIEDAETLERIRLKYGLPSRFVLAVGTIQPRKNYVQLVEAFARLEISDVQLVIVGGKGWLYEGTFQVVRDLRLDDRVLFAGFVDDRDLPAVYNLAEVLCMPSRYEGFGIPPLEAMACGTPVIVADNSSLPEVVGDAGILVETGDTDALADALGQLLLHPALNAGLVERGLSQARKFSWTESARSLLATYNRLCDMQRRPHARISIA